MIKDIHLWESDPELWLLMQYSWRTKRPLDQAKVSERWAEKYNQLGLFDPFYSGDY